MSGPEDPAEHEDALEDDEGSDYDHGDCKRTKDTWLGRDIHQASFAKLGVVSKGGLVDESFSCLVSCRTDDLLALVESCQTDICTVHSQCVFLCWDSEVDISAKYCPVGYCSVEFTLVKVCLSFGSDCRI